MLRNKRICFPSLTFGSVNAFLATLEWEKEDNKAKITFKTSEILPGFLPKPKTFAFHCALRRLFGFSKQEFLFTNWYNPLLLQGRDAHHHISRGKKPLSDILMCTERFHTLTWPLGNENCNCRANNFRKIYRESNIRMVENSTPFHKTLRQKQWNAAGCHQRDYSSMAKKKFLSCIQEIHPNGSSQCFMAWNAPGEYFVLPLNHLAGH